MNNILLQNLQSTDTSMLAPWDLLFQNRYRVTIIPNQSQVFFHAKDHRVNNSKELGQIDDEDNNITHNTIQPQTFCSHLLKKSRLKVQKYLSFMTCNIN